MTDLAKQMWDAYAKQAGGVTFDGKPLPDWDGLGEDRQICWVAAAKVAADRIEALEAEVKRLEQQLKMARRLAHRSQPEYPPEIGIPHLRED